MYMLLLNFYINLNSVAEKDNILILKDNKYDLELDLLNDFKVDIIITNPKIINYYYLN